MKNLHRQAFEWLMKEQDGRLDEASRKMLHQHLAECSQCRQDAALLSPLEQATRNLPLAQAAHPVTGRQIAGAVQHEQAQQAAREPMQGVAWGAAVFALLILIGLLNDLVQPNVAVAASWLPVGLGQAPAAAGIDLTNPPQWLFWDLIYLSGILVPLLVGCAGVAMAMRRWFNGWLAFLLVGFTLGLGLFCFSLYLLMNGFGIYTLLLIPFLTTLLELLILHLWSNHEQWTWLTWALIGIYFAGITAFIAFMVRRSQGEVGFSIFSLVSLALFVILPALTWLAWEWRRPWRWLGTLVWGLVLVGLLLSFLVYSPFILARYAWIEVIISASSFLWVLAGVTLTGRLVYTSQVKPRSRRDMWMISAALVLLFASLFADIHSIALQNSVAEDPILGGIMAWFACSVAVSAAVAIAWKVKGRHLWVCLAIIGIFTFGLFPAQVIPEGSARQVTEGRAAQINQAVLHFYSQNQRYPTSLAELEPGFIWQVPAPITSNGGGWCYDGDDSYYRLGYFDNYQYTFPDQIKLKVYAQAGKVPAQPSPCQLALDKMLR